MLKTAAEMHERALSDGSEPSGGLFLHEDAWGAVGGLVAELAPAGTAVLLVGRYREDAEALARFIHSQSGRNTMPFIRTRCGLFRAKLLEQRFFGRGAGHSRAHFRRVGRQPGQVEQADGGTLYVEQLQLATALMQQGLLKLLDGQAFVDPETGQRIEADVRIIATVPTGIEGLARAGRIDGELARRLSGAAMPVPSYLAACPLIRQGLKETTSPQYAWR